MTYAAKDDSLYISDNKKPTNFASILKAQQARTIAAEKIRILTTYGFSTFSAIYNFSNMIRQRHSMKLGHLFYIYISLTGYLSSSSCLLLNM